MDNNEQLINFRENQEMMNTIMDNATISITLTDYDGHFTFFNKQAERNLRHPPEILKSKTIVELFPEEGPSTLADIRQIFKDKKPLLCEVSYHIEGKIYFFEINRLPLFNSNGEVFNVMSISRDITEIKRQEHLLKIQHQIDSVSNIGVDLYSSLDIVFQHLSQIDWIDCGGIYLSDEKKGILELVYSTGLSDRFINLVSKVNLTDTYANMVAEKSSLFISVPDFKDKIGKEMIEEGLKSELIIPMIHQDEVIGALNLASRKFDFIDDFDKKIIESIAFRLANLIMLVKTRMELNNSNNELTRRLKELSIKQQMLIQKSRLESLGELSAGLAHEINQPLSIISLAMENINYKLGQHAASEEYLNRKFITINQNINKIRQLIDHVRIFSRDQGTIMFERVDVNQVITNALSVSNSQLRHHHIDVKTAMSEDSGYTIGNPSRLEQVILNLISNARDAIEDKTKQSRYEGQRMEIRISTVVENEKIVIRVWDNGAGISAENLPRIFNPFFTTKSAGEGTGLGLPIVYGIVREMKGEITARSDEGVYTEITITLPLYKNNVEKNS